jgi:hypothetical protein
MTLFCGNLTPEQHEQIRELEREAERLAEADFLRVAGKVIITREGSGVTGHNEHGDSVEVFGEFRVIVDRTSPHDDLHHWNDEFLDPYWNVTPAEDYPELRGLRSFWTFGPSYRIADNQVIPEGAGIAIDNSCKAVWDRIRLKFQRRQK